jgi:hypothetical protein
MIVAFTGKAGSGKTFEAQKLAREKISEGIPVVHLSFAMPLKQMIEYVFGMTKYNCKPCPFLYSSPLSLQYKIDGQVDKWYNIKPTENKHTDIYPSINHLWNMIYDKNCQYRQIIQLFGTEIMQNMYYESIWCDMLKIDNSKIFETQIYHEDFRTPEVCIIIDDLRFKHEFEFLKNLNARKLKIVLLETDTRVRAERLGVDMDQLAQYDLHPSESWIGSDAALEMMKPWM